MKKRRDQNQIVTKAIALMSLVVVVVGGYFMIAGYQSQKTVNNGSTSTNSYYSLRNNATDYQKELYEQLTTGLEETPRNHEKLSALVAQNYIADFYTWTNKLSFNDLGGIQFVHSDIRKGVYDKALDQIYNDMNYYLTQNQIKDTLEVVSSTTTVEPVKFVTVEEKRDYKTDEITVAEETVDAYQVHITWTYKDSTVVKTSEYDSEAYITIMVDDDGLYSIVEVVHEQESNQEA